MLPGQALLYIDWTRNHARAGSLRGPACHLRTGPKHAVNPPVPSHACANILMPSRGARRRGSANACDLLLYVVLLCCLLCENRPPRVFRGLHAEPTHPRRRARARDEFSCACRCARVHALFRAAAPMCGFRLLLSCACSAGMRQGREKGRVDSRAAAHTSECAWTHPHPARAHNRARSTPVN